MQIRERVRILSDQALEFGAARELPAEHVQERLKVMLKNPEQRDHVPARIVDHLDLRHVPPAQEEAAHADERLRVDPVRDVGNPLDQVGRELLLPSDIPGGRPDWPHRSHLDLQSNSGVSDGDTIGAR